MLRIPRRKASILTSSLIGCVLVVAGCGASVSTGPDQISGKTLAEKANPQLEKENPNLVHGDLTCKKVAFKVGATTRCRRTLLLSAGRKITIGATVTVDRVKKGGHFKIRIDDKPEEYGLVGSFIEKDLTKQYTTQFGTPPERISCPYLEGRVGNKVTCDLTDGDGKHEVKVTVNKVDEANYDTDYVFAAGSLQPSA